LAKETEPEPQPEVLQEFVGATELAEELAEPLEALQVSLLF
jgi:hypothetical protein